MDEQLMEIASRLAATLDSDVDEMETLAKWLQDTSTYGGGIILGWVDQVRKLKKLLGGGQ